MAGRVRQPCKFFLQGTCRNGSNCRFSHEAPFGGRGRQNGGGGFGGRSNNAFGGSSGSASSTSDASRVLAIEELRNPSLWPLSGCSVHKGLPNIVNGDLSYEESRWEAYEELKATGGCGQHTHKMQTLRLDMQRQRDQAVAMLEDPKTAERMIAGDIIQLSGPGLSSFAFNPFGGNAGSGGFGSTSSASQFGGGAGSPFGASVAPTSSPFGKPTNPFDATTGANPFGGASPAASPFGGPSPTTAAALSSPFSVASTSSSPFGGGSAHRPSNPFGGGSTSFGQPSGLEGNANASGGATTTSAFGTIGGGGATATPIPFGVPAAALSNPFGSASPRPMSTFGSSSTSTSPFGSGSGSSAFGQPIGLGTAGPASSPFGSPTVTNSPFGGGSPIPGGASPFGSSTSGHPFGGAAAPSSSPFGGFQSGALPKSSSFDPVNFTSFDVKQPPTNTRPVAPVPARPTSRPVREITEEELTAVRDETWNAQQFEAAEFRIGMVPTVPPPPQFCQ